MGGDGLRDHVTKGAITMYLAHAGDSGHDDRDVCNSVGPLCAQHSTQRCGTLLGRGQSGFRLCLFAGGAACKPFGSVYVACVPAYAANAKPSGSANMPGAPFAVNGPPGVFGM